MSAQLTILASGSGGNAAFLTFRGFGLLIDCGIGPRSIADRLTAASAKWANISAVILTHTHGDHWKATTFERMLRERIPLILHTRHASFFESRSEEFACLKKAGLVKTYREGDPFALIDGLVCRPIPVPHDSDPTFAFRLDGIEADGISGWSLGYASDLGSVPKELHDEFRHVDVLAIEFNHDVDLQRRSYRPAELIARVLGDHGHLSNIQAAEFARSMASDRSNPLQSIVQLHLSRECNRMELAQSAAKEFLPRSPWPSRIITATQDRPTPTIAIRPRPMTNQPRQSIKPLGMSFQASLPGLE